MSTPAFSAASFRQRRRQANLSQQQLASDAGLGMTTVRDLEQGRVTSPSAATVVALAQALGCLVEDLFTEPEDVEDRQPRRTARSFGHLSLVGAL